MTKIGLKATEKKLAEEASTLYRLVRKVLLAGVGAVVLAQEEVEAFVRLLVDQGQLLEQEGERLLAEWREKQAQAAKELAEEGETQEEMPATSEIERLSATVDALNEKLEKIIAARQNGPRGSG